MRRNPKENWVITPDTHEAIIDQESFEKIQQICEKRYRITKTGKSSIFSGQVYCADCGCRLKNCITNKFEKRQDYFDCATHHTDRAQCKSHYIRESVLKQLVWDHLKLVLACVFYHEAYFRAYMQKTLDFKSKEEMKSLAKQRAAAEARIADIDRLYRKLYEDNVNGKITDDRFQIFSEQYESEQTALKAKAAKLQTQIELQRQNAENLEKFVTLVKKHVEDDGLTGYNLHELIRGINIENCDADIAAEEATRPEDDPVAPEASCDGASDSAQQRSPLADVARPSDLDAGSSNKDADGSLTLKADRDRQQNLNKSRALHPNAEIPPIVDHDGASDAAQQELRMADGAELTSLNGGKYDKNGEGANAAAPILPKAIRVRITDIENSSDDEASAIYESTVSRSAKTRRIRKIHIQYDFVGFIPIKSLLQFAEEAEKPGENEKSA